MYIIPRKLGYTRDEDEVDVLGAVLDDAVEAAQVLPVGLCQWRFAERVEGRPVVPVHEDHHALAGGPVQVEERGLQALGIRFRGPVRIKSGGMPDQFQLHENAPSPVPGTAP